MPDLLTGLGATAFIMGVVAFIYAWRARCSAYENGHSRPLVWLGLGVIAFVTLLSLGFLFVPITDTVRFQTLRHLQRIARILSPTTIAAFIVYLAASHDDPRACRDRQRAGRGASGDMGPTESDAGIGGHERRQRQDAP